MRYVGEKQPVLLDSGVSMQNEPTQLRVLCSANAGLGPLSLTAQTFCLL